MFHVKLFSNGQVGIKTFGLPHLCNKDLFFYQNNTFFNIIKIN